MKKRILVKIVLFAIAAVMIASFAACGLFPSEDNIVAPALKTPKPVEYQFYSVTKGDIIKGSSGTGSMTSIYYYKHAFPSSGGIIKAVYVTLGQYVNKGDLLVETDNSALELDFLEASIEYTEAKDKFDKIMEEYNKGNVDDTSFRIEQLKYQYVEAKYTNLKNAYENTKLIAQVSGKVVYINTEYTTNTNKEIVAGETIVAIDSEDEKYMYLVFDKSLEAQRDSAATPQQFKVGTVLTLTLNPTKADPDPIKFEGVIVGTDQIVKDTGIGYLDSAKYYCKLTSYPDYGYDESRRITSGTLIRYTYVEDSREDVLTIPINTCYEYNGKHYVYMLDYTTNLKKEVYVELGLANDSYVEVISGLKRGDRIVTN
ncbi:MAG: biotin/lipoyl-binding protein [Clostridia bacterium]|nr:biotin/lipoyl-binding protein [Clostridia bacterium]